jgi:two-component system, LytTR family, sensor kinase
MVKDKYIRLLFIPLLGILIPYASHIITYSNYELTGLLTAHLYFIFTSFCIWTGSNLSHKYLRSSFNLSKNAFLMLAIASLVSIIVSAVIGGILTWLWFKFSGEIFTKVKLQNFIIYTSIAVTVFTFFYEVVFLSSEKEEHIKLVDELDRERLYAETAILRNEMDPHFIFNSLTTLNELIKNDPETAARYNDNLAQVYKYVLKSKNSEAVPLAEELNFLEEYFLLLQIRHGNKLQLKTNSTVANYVQKLIIPCALQILVENAVKHNEFSEEIPLQISININGASLKVSNNIMPRPFLINSTETGLKNLSSRYKLLCNQELIINKTDSVYSVTVPLLSTNKPYSHA